MLPSIVSYETEREPCVPAEYGHVGDVTWAGLGPDRGRYTYGWGNDERYGMASFSHRHDGNGLCV